MDVGNINGLGFEDQYNKRINVLFYKTAFMKYFRAGGFSRYMEKNPSELVECDRARQRWVTIAGSYYKGVDVVDGGGNVLLSVPPLLEQLEVTNESESMIDAVNVLEKYPRPTSQAEATAMLSGVVHKTVRSEEQVIAEWMTVIRFDPDAVQHEVPHEDKNNDVDIDLRDSYDDSDLYE